jgi:hypothetical protein
MLLKRIPPGTGYEAITEAVASEFGALLELVRQALRDKVRTTPGMGDWYIDVQGIWPERVVARMNGRTYSWPYTMQADNTVALGEGAEVVLSFTAVREAAAPAAANAAFREAADGSIEVTLIRAGTSLNGNGYTDAALQDAVPLFEGVRVFVKSDADHTKGAGKDVRNLIGGVYGVRFVAGGEPDMGALVGTFRAIDPADGVVTKMVEAVKRGMQGLMGLSIDAVARTKRELRQGKSVRMAHKFVRVNSVDLIVEPGAGGGLDRLTEATEHPKSSEEDPMKNRFLLALAAISAASASAVATDASPALVMTKLTEACAAAKLDLVQVLEAAEKAESDDAVAPAVARLVEAAKAQPQPQTGTQRLSEAAGGAGDDAPVTRAELQQWRVRQAAARRIAESKLPKPAITRLQAAFDARERFTEADVETAIKGEREYLAHFTESGAVRVGGAGSIEVQDRSVVVKDMLDAFFDPAHKHYRDVQSFKECYIEITGDRRVTGRLEHCDRSRLSESLGAEFGEFREAISSSTFANVLGDSIARRMLDLYGQLTDLQAWRRVATVTPVMDFRTQERTTIGGYGNLPAVAQGAGYAALTSPGDLKATYAVSKRGGLETVTLEAIKNDDVRAIRRIPQEMALAAANTLYEFVLDFFRTNPTIYDAAALYTAPRGNLFVAALSGPEYAVHRLAMAKLTRLSSAKRRGVTPARILVPFDLQETAYNLFVRNQNLDKTFVQSINPEVIPVAYWTDVNDWVTVADPMAMPVLEIGFLDGKEEPELFMQDMPNVGSLFSNDQITYKIRHIYGGNVLPEGEKGTTKAVVP